VAAKGNLGQFFVLGDCWFFVHGSLLKIKKWAVPGGNVPPFDQIYDLILDAFLKNTTFPGLLMICMMAVNYCCEACLPEALLNSITNLLHSTICPFSGKGLVRRSTPEHFL
jgi:hypothetical protein